MLIKTTKSFQVSLDDGLTVKTYLPGEHNVQERVGKLAINHYGAKEIKKLSPQKKAAA